MNSLILSEGQSFSIKKVLPYNISVNSSDMSADVFAASLEDGTPTITPERGTWLRDVNGELLFDSNSQLLEVA